MANITRLSIGGMSCAGCVSSVENALSSVAGTTNVLVSLGERTASVKGDVNADELIKVVRDAGYDAALLEDESDEAEKEADELREYRRLWYRAIVAGMIGALLFLSGMSGLLPPIEQSRPIWFGISLITLLVLVFVGGHFFRGAWHSILNRRANMDTLVSLGTGTAWLYSTLVVLFPAAFPSLARHAYFEAAVIIIALVSLGSALESKARGKTSLAIKKLVGLQPETASVIRDGVETEIAVGEITLDETIRIRPGGRIPVDGRIIQGESHVDESMLTGESIPVAKDEGSQLFGGTLNTSGSFLMLAERIGRDTALAQIVDQVRMAQASKPPIGRIVDKVTAVFVPVVLLIALLSALVWYLLGPEPQFSYAIVTLMTVLVIACPCALGLATPISIMVGIGRAAEKGVLIRNGDALQQASRVTTVVIDKTGTITEGKPTVTHLIPSDEYSEGDLLLFAAALESHSEHPIAKAIVEAAQGMSLPVVDQFEAVKGMGASGALDDGIVSIGNHAFMDESDIDVSLMKDTFSRLSEKGVTPVYVAVEKSLAGLIGVADKERPDSRSAIEQMHRQNLKLVMLTGDNRETAMSIAQNVGIDEVIADILPDGKADVVAKLQNQGKIVAMIGDGINDAPALARSDGGVALFTGTDVAVESADITLMRNSLDGLNSAISLSKATLGNIKQNLFGAFIYNVLGIPVAAGILFPAFGILLNPVFAAAAMSLSSVTVVSNALRLRSK